MFFFIRFIDDDRSNLDFPLEESRTISKIDFVTAINEIFGSNCFEGAALYVFALASATTSVGPESGCASSSTPSLASAFTAFR